MPPSISSVATVLTVYGIETYGNGIDVCFKEVATVLTVYGIETVSNIEGYITSLVSFVATVLTVYGIETAIEAVVVSPLSRLQQYLPFTVLKLNDHANNSRCDR